jgi:hypothetical protein
MARSRTQASSTRALPASDIASALSDYRTIEASESRWSALRRLGVGLGVGPGAVRA